MTNVNACCHGNLKWCGVLGNATKQLSYCEQKMTCGTGEKLFNQIVCCSFSHTNSLTHFCHSSFLWPAFVKLSCSQPPEAAPIGGSAMFSCEANGGPGLGLTAPSRTEVDSRYIYPRPGIIFLNIRFNNISMDDIGRRYCIQAKNTESNVSTCLRIPVKSKCLECL